jgi:hypothetical protein
MIGKMLAWLQERIKRWTKPGTLPLISVLMLATSFMGENISLPYASKRRNVKIMVFPRSLDKI